MEKNMHNKIIGKYGEDIACRYLCSKGYKLIERNYIDKCGEIDIIVKKKAEIVFVEVKTRSSKTNGEGVESVTRQKIRHIKNVSKMYVIKNRLYNYSIRYDVIDIDLSNIPYTVKHFKAVI